MAVLTAVSIEKILKTKYETIVLLSLSAGVNQTYCKSYVLSLKKNNIQSDVLSDSSNKDALSFDGTVIHNMYDMDDIWYHNQAARQHRYVYEIEYDYLHIYRRPNNLITSSTDKLLVPLSNSIFSITHSGNTLYAIDNLSTFGHCFVNDLLLRWLINDNGWPLPPTKYMTASLYAVNDGKSRTITIAPSDVEKYFSTKLYAELSTTPGIYALSSLVGMQWNTIYEIPGNIKQDYSKGELIANTFKAKNLFDGNDWSMTSASVNSKNCLLYNARTYNGIYSCGNLIWLKWKDTKSWVETTDENEIISEYPDIYGRKDVKSTADVDATVPYPLIETIAAINRGIQAPTHKSTLYSLNLKTKIMQKIENSSIANKEDIKDRIKLELQACMRKIAESIQPANCLLFATTVEG